MENENLRNEELVKEMQEMKKNYERIMALMENPQTSKQEEAPEIQPEPKPDVKLSYYARKPLSDAEEFAAFTDAEAVFLSETRDYEEIGVIINGRQFPLSRYDAAADSYSIPDISRIDKTGLTGEREKELQENISGLMDAVYRENAYCGGKNLLRRLTTLVIDEMQKNGHINGRWEGILSTEKNPQNYIRLSYKGFAASGDILCLLETMHENERRDGVHAFNEIDKAIFAENVMESLSGFEEYLAGSLRSFIEKMDTDLSDGVITYSSCPGDNPLKEFDNMIFQPPEPVQEEERRLDIKTILNVDNDIALKRKEGSCLASGWVEIENAIKFPIRVMKWNNPKTNKDEMFVGYPNKKSGDEYENILYPKDPNVRRQIQDAVLKEVREKLIRNEGLDIPDVSEVRVALLKEQKKTGSVAVKAVASITICGIEINGITIKEGKYGMFVQMPQRRERNGEYRDVVYGINAPMQEKIKKAVLDEYERMIPQPQPEPKPQPEPEPQPEPKPQPEPEPQPEPKPQPEPQPQPKEEGITITNAQFEGGYMRFDVVVNGEVHAGIFRIYAPKDGPDMTLLGIDDSSGHPLLAKALPSIEAGLQEKMQGRYERLKAQEKSPAKAAHTVHHQPTIKM